MKLFRRNAFAICIFGMAFAFGAEALAQNGQRLPKPVPMDSGVQVQRDRATGDLVLRYPKSPGATTETPKNSPAVLRVRVNLVEVGCNVFSTDGTAVRGIPRSNFRVFQDGAEQDIAHFDASSQGASIALVIDASPSVLPDTDAMKAAGQQIVTNLSPADEVAVVDFAEHTYLLLPFSQDRALLQKAIARVDVRSLFSQAVGSNIYRSVYLAADELFPGRTGRKAIILLTDGQDSGLGLNLDGEGVRPRPGDPPNRATLEDVVRALSSQGIEVYAISTQNRPRVMTPEWLAAHQANSLITPDAINLGIPAYTDFLAELVRRAGGQIYFLNETRTIANAYREIIQNLSAQYTLGFYPPPQNRAGWHSLRVEVSGQGTVRIVHRLAYYASADLR
ncbi:MAG: VWA domain-containing protein [Candidatus Acidiferrales bacterium]